MEEGSGWETHVYQWRIHVGIWQNQYNIVKFKNKIKLKKKESSQKKKKTNNKIRLNVLYHFYCNIACKYFNNHIKLHINCIQLITSECFWERFT